ncbi:MAG: hypothetical protein K9G49_13620 [Taibaiella sp.]|nr:hypothetical protein [Taibaiella sp.]
MLRILILGFFLHINGVCSYAHQPGIIELRDMYYAAYRDKAAAEKFYAITDVKAKTLQIATLQGYNAVASIMMCNHVLNPYSRLKYFYNGRSKLEKAISTNPKSVELRYLRFAVQCNVPGILNYNGQINEDRAILLTYLLAKENKTADPDLYNRIGNYMMSSKDVPDTDKHKIKEIM